MTSFYPGPSRVYDDIPKYVKDAHRKGILSMNHRSEEFMAIVETTVSLLKKKLSIPDNYSVFFTSSATECWEIIAQSVVEKESIHLFNGAFGEKWYDYTKRLRPGAQARVFDRELALHTKELRFKSGQVICLTQNETSNGTQVTNKIIAGIKKNNPNHLVAVDATSSMAGIYLDFKAGDIWFASVQKCFGLPAGLALMICSQRAIARIQELGENKHYNSMTFLKEMMARWQTPYTPNVLGIYLLMRIMKKVKPIGEIHSKLNERYDAWVKLFSHSKRLTLMIKNDGVRSMTVIAVASKKEDIQKVKGQAKSAGFLLGEGYGLLKKDTFRIANFPAIKRKEIQKLMRFLMGYL